MKSEEKKRILSKLNDMIKYTQELEMMLPTKDEYLLDLIKRRACEKTVEAAIETMIDVAAMIVSAEKLGLPSDEENIFDLLNQKEILNDRLCKKAKKMKGFRNILIHRYVDTNNELVYKNITNHINDFYEFEKKVKIFFNTL